MSPPTCRPRPSSTPAPTASRATPSISGWCWGSSAWPLPSTASGCWWRWCPSPSSSATVSSPARKPISSASSATSIAATARGCGDGCSAACVVIACFLQSGLQLQQVRAITRGEPRDRRDAWSAPAALLPALQDWMFTRPHGMDFFVNIRATMLDDHAWYAPFVEVYTAEKLPWATTPAVHSFATQPDLEGYRPLVEAFAREGARPA